MLHDLIFQLQKKVFDLLYQIADISFLSQHKDKIIVSHIILIALNFLRRCDGCGMT